jgi:hypothetical protein
MPDAHVVGINRTFKTARIMTADGLYTLIIRPQDVSLVRELLDLVEAEDDC